MTARRIASLLPAGTEMVAALGCGDRLVGISHECDHPADVTDRPRLTVTPIDQSADSGRIDRQVRELSAAGVPVIAVDGAARAAVRPDLVITQDLCQVCAVVDGDVRTIADSLDPAPELLPLRARDLAGIGRDIRAVARAIGVPDRGEALADELRVRLAAIGRRAEGPRPRVVFVEWLDPLFLAGHWVPEMIGIAGGIDVGAAPGSHSVTRPWADVAALDPDLLIVGLCGFGLDRARLEWTRFVESEAGKVAGTLRAPVGFIDGNAFTSRPGPRVVDGVERLAAIVRSWEARVIR